MRPIGRMCFGVLVLALGACDAPLPTTPKNEPTAVFEPSPVVVGVGRSQEVVLRTSRSAVREVSLDWKAEQFAVSGLACDPATSCSVSVNRPGRAVLLNSWEHIRVVRMLVTGRAPGTDRLSAEFINGGGCDFVGFCSEATTFFQTVTVEVRP